MTCSTPFSVAASILTTVAPPHLGSVIAGFADAAGDQLPSLMTIIGAIAPESPVVHLVESLVPQAQAGYEIEPGDVEDAADDAVREIDQLIGSVPEGDWFIAANAVLWRRWDGARELAIAIRQARRELEL